jgi:hypothetical protein
MKTSVLLVHGDGDYGAMYFEDNFDADVVYQNMLEEGVTETTLLYDDGYGEEDIYVELYEFGEVDASFIDFMFNEFIDYDATKCKNFFIVS